MTATSHGEAVAGMGTREHLLCDPHLRTPDKSAATGAKTEVVHPTEKHQPGRTLGTPFASRNPSQLPE